MFFSESYGNYFYSDKIIWLNLIQKIKFLEKNITVMYTSGKTMSTFPYIIRRNSLSFCGTWDVW